MIYVDELNYQKPNGKKKYCHMFADDLIQLEAFAELIGRKRAWFHKMRVPELCHYDLDQKFRESAIENGAIVVNTRDYLNKLKKKEI